MQNRTDIINTALQRCGAAGINAAFQNSQEAAIAAAAYDHSLHYLLAQYKWSFAERYAALALNEDVPPFGYKYSFALPADCLQVIDIHRYTVDEDGDIQGEWLFRAPKAQYAIVGRDVYSNEDLLALRYITSEVNSFPEVFANALAWRLAFEISPYLQQGTNQAQSYYQLYMAALEEAKAENDIQQKPERPPAWAESPHIRMQFMGPPDFERW